MLIVGIQICLTEAFTFLTCKCGFFFFHSQRQSRLSCSIQEKYCLTLLLCTNVLRPRRNFTLDFFQTSRSRTKFLFPRKFEETGFHCMRVFRTLERETAVPSSVTRVTLRISSYSRLRTELLARGEIFALDVSI